MKDWLQQRRVLLDERSGRCHSEEARREFLLKHDQQGPLFVARRARCADSVLPAMPPVTVYYTIANALKKFRRCYQVEVGSTDGAGQGQTYVAKGAAIIRNSVIAHWLQTLGVMETLRLAGLKNAASLRLPLPVGPVPVATES